MFACGNEAQEASLAGEWSELPSEKVTIDMRSNPRIFKVAYNGDSLVTRHILCTFYSGS